MSDLARRLLEEALDDQGLAELDRLLGLATVVTWPRAGHPIDASTLAGLDLSAAERDSLLANALAMPADDVSATALRRRLAAGEVDSAAIDPAIGLAAWMLDRAHATGEAPAHAITDERAEP